MCNFPAFLHPYIDTITDVEDDGNCGYRSIAALLGHSASQDGWPWVRASLIEELETNVLMYNRMWGTNVVYGLHERLTLPLGDPATPDKWFQLPEMGYLVATKYQLVLVSLSSMGCNTYFPLIGAGPPDAHIVIAIGHVTNHWVQLQLTPGHPMPTVAPQWDWHVDLASKYWRNPYGPRLDMYAAQFQAWLGVFSGHADYVVVNDNHLDIIVDWQVHACTFGNVNLMYVE
ncbi:uncharacterized protein LOC130729437 [Lotus japonicus]|uniref:uncharacterized protein LOC130729437 n=1 Tax=Lotus japonicus TaxID=34305 RepID=UPI00258D47D7|nr:uncharacterized protein LOC130729437 [Lotus japonicus]